MAHQRELRGEGFEGWRAIEEELEGWPACELLKRLQTAEAPASPGTARVNTIDRVLAIDWSGDKTAARRKIWLCEVASGRVLRLESGRSREEVGEHLIEGARRDPRFVVGLDFAFSFPAGFLKKRAHKRVETVWEEAELLGENWLAHCPNPPFWGKPGKKKPALGDLLQRKSELAVARKTKRRPMSVFQIGGAGTVGVGSIRGMPVLRRLRRAGFSIWPFHEPALPLVVEIWPRVFMGEIRKSSQQERLRHLEQNYPEITGAVRDAAERSDDAFDALVSALEMDRHRNAFGRLRRADDWITQLEGRIWQPGLS